MTKIEKTQANRFCDTMEALGVPPETTEMLRPAPRRRGRGPSEAKIREWRYELDAINGLIELRGKASDELLAAKAEFEAKLARAGS